MKERRENHVKRVGKDRTLTKAEKEKEKKERSRRLFTRATPAAP